MILMVIEARKLGVKYVWAYILAGFAIAISVTFPLFLLARELRLEKSDATHLRPIDSILLALFAILDGGLRHLGGCGLTLSRFRRLRPAASSKRPLRRRSGCRCR